MKSNHTGVAKNAVYLYVRTLVTTLVGIYTSRIILQVLGIDDYGVYNVVGSVAGFFSFLNGSMSSATSRFITLELGRGDRTRLHNTFCTAMMIHIGIALLVVALTETIGLWFMANKMVIPAGRELAAHWVFQLSALTTMIGITQVPYTACMMAHERFDVYAYLDMVGTFAKLGILYLVRISPYDHLIFYAILLALISLFSCLYARIYCIRHYPESHLGRISDKSYFRPMLSFSGWELFGNLSWMAKSSGTNMLVNVFYGIAVNAAVGIGNTVSGAVNGLSYNVVAAFQPGIIKKYAQGETRSFENVVIKAGLYSSVMYCVFMIPLVLELDFILQLWLGTVPPYTASICALCLLFNTIQMVSIVVSTTLRALGQNSGQNISSSLTGVGTLLLLYLVMATGHSLVIAFLVFNAVTIVNLLCVLYLLQKYTTGAFVRRIVKESIVRPLLFEGGLFIALASLTQCMEPSFGRVCLTGLSSVLLHAMMVYGFLMNGSERETVKNRIKEYLPRS